MISEAYKSRSADALPGIKGTYKPPVQFVHGQWNGVAHLPPLGPDGAGVFILELRMPARFFRLEVLDKRGPDGEMRVGTILQTGTLEPRLVAEIANAIADGMLGLAPT